MLRVGLELEREIGGGLNIIENTIHMYENTIMKPILMYNWYILIKDIKSQPKHTDKEGYGDSRVCKEASSTMSWPPVYWARGRTSNVPQDLPSRVKPDDWFCHRKQFEDELI